MASFVNTLQGDRRSAHRHPLKVPIRFRLRKLPTSEHATESQNVSELGIFFTTKEELGVGTGIDLFVEMHKTVDGSSTWLCTGHVVRVDRSSAGGACGVGVQFDCFDTSCTTFPDPTERNSTAL